jgi:cardiolipin synthase
MRHLPNLLTVLRIILVFPLIYALLQQDMKLAFWLFFAAGWTDLFDGYLARNFKLKSKLGAFLDPLADKLLMGSTYILTAYLGLIPLSLMFLVITREIAMMIGLMTYYFVLGAPKFKANFISKVNTVVEGILMLNVLLSASGYIILPLWVHYVLIAGVVITILWSFILYAKQGLADLRRHGERQ